jgi:hypothetical protein
VWEALIAVADAAGGDWPRLAREAAKALIKESKDREPSLGVLLLAHLRTVFGNTEQMTSDEVLRALHAMPETPWNDIKGKPLDQRGLAHRLRQYGIKPKVIRVGNSTPRGYTRDSFHDAWKAYLPPLPPDRSATSATSATGEEKPNDSSGEDVADVDDGERKQHPNKRKRGPPVLRIVLQMLRMMLRQAQQNPPLKPTVWRMLRTSPLTGGALVPTSAPIAASRAASRSPATA